MKLVFSEFTADSKNYRYPYQVYAIREDETLENIYGKGFLPSRSRKNLFYLSRSLRIDLSTFELSSENRRIKKKTDYLEIEPIMLKDFEYDYTIGKLGKDFYDKRFGKGTMSAFRLKWLFTSGSMTHVLQFRDGDDIFGYCLANSEKGFIHYAYPFYELKYFKRDAGMGMMLETIEWAKAQGMRHVYLGTCYTEQSLYKVQFKGIQWFTGYSWSDDVKKLKNLVRSDSKEGHDIERSEEKDEIFESGGITY